jgi:hypothetical protein
MTKPDLLFVLGIYVLAHGLMVLNNGVFWDDWLIVGGSPSSVADLYREYGLPLFDYYHTALDSLGIPAYRILVFLSYLVAPMCLYGILRRMPEIDRKTALLLVLLFVLFPSNSARISIMASRTSVCAALFFIGLWLAAVYLDRRIPALRVVSLVFLFASFLTHSLLVFYIVVPIYIAYHERAKLRSVAALWSFVLRHLDFLLLPVLFWVLKLVFYEPYGTFRGYNRVTAGSALEAFSFIDNAFFAGFIYPLVDSFRMSPMFIVPAAVLAIVGARLLARLDTRPATGPTRDSWWLLAAGIVFFVAGVFAYLAVGKIPSAEDWDSRHQLLTPLGASFMLVSLPRLVLKARGQNLVSALLVVLFTAGAVNTWIDFQRDWYKQVALIENFRITPEIENGTHFLIDDRTTDLDANGRRYRSYEYSGLFQAAFGDLNRLGRSLGRQETGAVGTTVTIEHGALKLTAMEVLKLRTLESWNEPDFRATVRQAVRVAAKTAGWRESESSAGTLPPAVRER